MKHEMAWKMLESPREDYCEIFVNLVTPFLQFRRKIELGGEALVLLVKDVRLDLPRVMKIAHYNLSEIAKKRFIRSVKVLSKLRSHYFPSVLFLSEEDSPLFVLLDWTPGKTLRELVNMRENSLSRSINILFELCKAVELLHNNDIIHRDIKPENILVNGQVKLIDFGLSKSQQDENLTQVEYALGTRKYSSPEQIQDAVNVDARTDICSLGRIFYYLMTSLETFEPEHLKSKKEIDFFRAATAPALTDRTKSVQEFRLGLEELFDLQEVKSEKKAYDKLDAFEDIFFILEGSRQRIKYYTLLSDDDITRLKIACLERRIQCFSD